MKEIISWYVATGYRTFRTFLLFFFSPHFPSSSFSVFHYINGGKLISTVISLPVSDPFSVIGVFRWIMSSHSLECIFLKELGPGLKVYNNREEYCLFLHGSWRFKTTRCNSGNKFKEDFALLPRVEVGIMYFLISLYKSSLFQVYPQWIWWRAMQGF